MTNRILGILIVILTFSTPVHSQNEKVELSVPQARMRRDNTPMTTGEDSVKMRATADSLAVAAEKALEAADSIADALAAMPTAEPQPSTTATPIDSLPMAVTIAKEPFVPDSKKAMWMAIVLPGGGQIYNRKYWKLPLIYGGFLGCAYALNWNNTMYRDYSQAFIDIMDSDPNTKSYMNFVPASYNVEANMDRLKELFKRKKNFYRRYRDMSVFCMIGVYALSIVDAYVDAELSSFDISPELSMKVSPTVISDRQTAMWAPSLNGQSYGLRCSLSF